jgi:hypothetical protein
VRLWSQLAMGATVSDALRTKCGVPESKQQDTQSIWKVSTWAA